MDVEQSDAFLDDQNVDIYEGQVRSMIAELAYSYAEERNFLGGDPEEDWLRAERSVEQILAGQQRH